MDSTDLALVLDFLEGKSQDVPAEQIARLQQLAAKATAALARTCKSQAARIQVLENKVSRMRKRAETAEEKAVADGTAFSELAIDSVDVINALVAHLRTLKTYHFTKDKVSYIFFEIYASWLYSKRERLCIEHPVATPYGPRFWHAWTQMDMNSGDGAIARLNAVNPGLSVMVGNAARKYYDYSLGDLERYIKKARPYAERVPKEGEKWNKEITDDSIFMWKKEQSGK